MMRKNLVKLAEMYPKEFHGKLFDYKCEKVGNHFVAYRHELENDPWHEYAQFAIVDGILFVNWAGNTVSMKEEFGHSFEGYKDTGKRIGVGRKKKKEE